MLALNAATAAEIAATNYLPGKPGVFSTAYQDALAWAMAGTSCISRSKTSAARSRPGAMSAPPTGSARSRCGGSLLAVTDDARMWHRSWPRRIYRGLPWAPPRFPPGSRSATCRSTAPVGITGLYAKPEPFVTPWQRIGHANDVTAMAAAAGHLFCATRDNSLWMRDPGAARHRLAAHRPRRTRWCP